jgi:hypothetical protein
MYAMQYEITLPADYDMKIIRHRVETKGHLLDTFLGLGIKAYLVRERGINGSPVNAYAPFYLWHDTAGMNQFLWGGAGFQGIIADFGRPTVRHWTGAAFQPGPARTDTPTAATRDIRSIPRRSDLIGAVDGAIAEAIERADRPAVHSSAVAIDPHHWELVHLTLWTQDPADVPGDRFEVLHLSAPHIDAIQPGRQW